MLFERQRDILWHMATTTGRASNYVTHPPQILINHWWRQVNRPFALWCGYFGLIGSKSGFIFSTSCCQQKERDLFFLQELPFFITATCILEGTVCLRSRSGGGGGIRADRGDEKGLCPGRRSMKSEPFVRKSKRRWQTPSTQLHRESNHDERQCCLTGETRA